jgi:hypothetical protein
LSFTVELEGVEEVARAWDVSVRELGAGVRRAVVLAGREGAEEGRRAATWKDRTGDARRTILSKLVKDVFGTVEADIVAPLHYHPYLDAGTRPHEIRPVRARFLRFIASDGALVFARRVMHPGTRGDGFAGRMYLKAERVLRAELEKTVASVAEKWG